MIKSDIKSYKYKHERRKKIKKNIKNKEREKDQKKIGTKKLEGSYMYIKKDKIYFIYNRLIKYFFISFKK